MSWLGDALNIISGVAQKLAPSTKVTISIAGTTMTVGDIETATGSLGSFFTAMEAAIKAKNIETGTELTIEEAVTIASDLGLGQPWTGIASKLLPIAFADLNSFISSQGPLIPINGGAGGFVTEAWAKNPRMQIDPKTGDFVNP